MECTHRSPLFGRFEWVPGLFWPKNGKANWQIGPNPKHHDGVLIFTHFARAVACCLLLLLAAKPGRSTLDTKKGYKTKTGSTSSVTLIKTEYWDRAGGGGNISYDW